MAIKPLKRHVYDGYIRVAVAAALMVLLPLIAAALFEGAGYAMALPLTASSPVYFPVSSPTALVGVDTGTNQAYVRFISVSVGQGVLQGASATVYFPADGFKLFLIEFYAFDSNGNLLDYALVLDFSSGNVYEATATFTGGVQIIEVDQLEVRVTCLLGC